MHPISEVPRLTQEVVIMSVSHFGCLLIMAVAMLASASGAFAAQRAEIGIVASDGTVQLYRDRFQEQFPDGTAVAEVRASISNGFLQLIRKGFNAKNACLQHVTRVVDAYGSHLSSLTPGQQLYLPELVPVEISACNDSGCADEIHAPSRCNITEKSDNRCRCHVRGPDNEIFISPSEGLCWSQLDRIHADLSHWVRLSFIQEF
jgi:hypothetical protein